MIKNIEKVVLNKKGMRLVKELFLGTYKRKKIKQTDPQTHIEETKTDLQTDKELQILA